MGSIDSIPPFLREKIKQQKAAEKSTDEIPPFLKKKEEPVAGAVSSPSLPPKSETPTTPDSHKDPESNLRVNGLLVPKGLDLGNFNRLMSREKFHPEEIDVDASKKISELSPQQLDDPLGHLYGSFMSGDKTPHDKAVTMRAANMVKQNLMSDGFEAKQILEKTHYGNKGTTNYTAMELRNRAAKYDKNTAPLREIPIPNEPYDKNENAKAVYMDLLQNASIKWYAGEHKAFAKELGNANVDIKDPDLAHRIDSGRAGEILNTYLNNKDVMTYLRKENPALIPAYEYAAKNNIIKNVEYGANAVATEVSQAVEKSGYNHIEPLFNYWGKNSQEYTNLVAEQLFKDDPDKLKIYNQYIRNNQSKYIDAPSVLENIYSGTKEVAEGVNSTLTLPFTTKDERQRERWIEEASSVSADPKGFWKFLSGTGKATGFVMGLAAGGDALEGIGFGPQTAQRVMAGLTFFGDQYGTAEEKYKNPLLAFTDASMNTAMFVAMSDIFPAAKAKAAFKEIQPEFSKVIENLANGKITREMARKEANNFFIKAIGFGGKALAQNTKMSLEMTGINALNQGLDQIFGLNEDSFNKNHPSGQLVDTFKAMFISNGIVSTMAAAGEMKKQNHEFDNSVYSAATNPLRYWRAIEDISVKNPSANTGELFDNLTFLSKTKVDLDRIKNKKGEPLSEKEKKIYLSAALKEKVLQSRIDKMPDATLQRAHGEDLRFQKEVKEAILKGEPTEPLYKEVEQEEKQQDVKKQMATIESAVVEVDGKQYEGKNHAEAILKAEADGKDISKIDRQAEGKFKLSDGTIIDRREAMERFGADHSEQLIPQDEAAQKANDEYKQKTEGEGPVLNEDQKAIKAAMDKGDIKGDVMQGIAKQAIENPETAKIFMQEVKDQASNRGGIYTPEQAVSRAKEVFGEGLVEHSKKQIDETPKQETVATAEPVKAAEKVEQPKEPDKNIEEPKKPRERKKITKAEEKPEPPVVAEKLSKDAPVEVDVFGTKIKGQVVEDHGDGMVTIRKEGTDFEMTVAKDNIQPAVAVEEKKPEEPEEKSASQKELDDINKQIQILRNQRNNDNKYRIDPQLKTLEARKAELEGPPKTEAVTSEPKVKRLPKEEQPEMEYPVYQVQVGDQTFHIQRSDGMNPGDTAWYEVVKDDKGYWMGPKGDAGVMKSGFLGYTKAEAIDKLLATRLPDEKTETQNINEPIQTKQPPDPDGAEPQPPGNVEKFNATVDEFANNIKDWLKEKLPSAKLPEGTQKGGAGFDDIVDAAATIVKLAYALGNDVKIAADRAIQYISDRWDKAWGDFNDFELEFRRRFERINPNVGQAMTKQEIQQLLDASRANNPSFLKRAAEAVKSSPVARLAVSTVRTFDPFIGGSKSNPSIYNDARMTAILLRKSLGKMQRENEVAAKDSEEFARFFEGMDEADRLMFITNLERGIDMGDQKLNAIAARYKQRMDGVFEAIKAIKDIPYLEDYFPHFWADPEAAKRVFAKTMSRSPMEGNKSMLRARFYRDIIEGMKEGLQLVTTNPEDLVRLAEINAYKFTMAHDFFNSLKDRDLAKFYAAGNQPEGWSLVDDPLFKRLIPTEKGSVMTGGWYMPNEAAEIVRRYSSRGIRGPLVDTIRGFNNMLNQAQLGISFFHGMTTTIDAAVTSNALGIDKLMRGKVMSGLWDLGTGVTIIPNLIRQLRVGGKAIKDFRSGVINKDVEMMMAANARTGVDVIYRTDMLDKFRRAWAGHEYGKVVLRAAPAVFDIISKPIFEGLVPRLKVGGFIRLAENELSKLKNPQQEQIDRTIQKVWDDMENRLGQMTYDNLFWDKTTKDLAFLATRSVGWNLGTLRAFAEGVAETPKSLATAVKGKGMSPRTLWAMALVGQTGLMGAVTTYLMTGHGPQDWRDYFYPRTGGTDKNGNDKRVQFPTYMKEVFNTRQRGIFHTIIAKASPLVNQTLEPINNQDFYGNMIRDPLDPAWKQGLDVLKYEAEQLVPFAWRDQPGEKPTATEEAVKKIGITPAPQYVIKNKDLGQLYQRLKDIQADTRDLRKKWKAGQISDDKYNDRFIELKNMEAETTQAINNK